ncbi:hypothetical protein [Sphingomonas sp. 22176]|uniref:hypothetical protein n=1 Tax=Sphingomonas sp. 22176 TaxID=3453884 RepID=UPI003F862FDA
MLQPHVSSFESASRDFALSGPLSEWLFVSGFWREAGSIVGISFDQYEEEAVSPEIAEIIVKMIERRIADLGVADHTELVFGYAHTANGEMISTRIVNEDAASELKALVTFMREAHEAADEVVFSL